MEMCAVDPTSHIVFNWMMAILSFLSNLLLISLVRNVNVSAMGSYSCLIYVSAVIDVTIALSNAIVVPNIHMGKFSFVVFGVGTCDWPALYGLISIYIFDLLFYQTFALLCFHFIYRYIVLIGSNSSLWNLNIWHWTAIGICFEIVFNAIMAFFISHFEPRTDWKPDTRLVSDMRVYYGINMSKPFGHFHVVYAEVHAESESLSVNWPIVIYTLSILGLIALLGVVMILCSICVLKMMRALSSDKNIRASTHRQFFRALVMQTVVPLTISFTPVGCLVLLPLTGLHFGALGNYLMSMTAVYPAIEPLLMIVCIQSYRRKIYGWIECCVPPKYRTKISRNSTVRQFTISTARRTSSSTNVTRR